MQSGKAPSERNEMEQVIKLRKHSSLPTGSALIRGIAGNQNIWKRSQSQPIGLGQCSKTFSQQREQALQAT